jgi:23S rRNA (adenine2503-C2)-methyltransferase
LAGDVVDRTRVRERAVHKAEIEVAEVESDAQSHVQPIEWLKKLN